MPTFSPADRRTPTTVASFTVSVTVSDTGPTAINYAAAVLDQNGNSLGTQMGDLTPYLTAQQITNFTNAATSLYTKAKAELLA